MPIDFQCTQCQHTLRVPDDSAGKKARCPQCGNVQEIPIPPAAPADSGLFAGVPSSHPQPYVAPPSGAAPQSRPQGYASDPYPYQPAAQYHPPPPKTYEQVRARVKPPAIAMLIVSALSMLLIGLVALVGLIVVLDEGGDEEDVITFVMLGVGLVVQLVVLVGSVRMLVMKNYGLAMSATIACLISGLCCQLALPFGIWALVILLDNDTRTHFR